MTVEEFEKKSKVIIKDLKNLFEELIKENPELSDVSFTNCKKYVMNLYIGYEFGKTSESYSSLNVFKNIRKNEHHVELFNMEDVNFNIIDKK